MKFDEILYTYLGEFGKYQKIQFFLVCVPTMFTAMHALSWTFTSAIPDHRCLLPDENSSTPFNLSDVLWKNLTPPAGKVESKCSRYKGMTVYSDDDNRTETEACEDGYKFDLSDLRNTAITRWTIVCDYSWIRAVVQSMYYVGQFFGSLVFGILGDKYGRKIVFFIAILLQIACGTIMAFVPNWQIFGILRIGLGFSHPGIFVIAVVIGSELVGPSKRRFAGVCTGVFFTFGQIILGLIAWALRDYQYIQLAISLPALVFVAYWWVVPESARWLVSMRRFEDADKILQNAARINKVQLPPDWHEQIELNTGEKQEPGEPQKKYGVMDLFRFPQIRKRALIAFFCWPVVSMVYYGLSMNPSFLGGDRYLVFIAAGAMEIPGLVFVFFTVDRLGRKALCSGGYFIAGFCLFVTLFIPEEGLLWLKVLQVILSKTAITATYAVIYTFTPELFPTPIRNSAMGCCSMIARVGAISASYIAMWLVEKSPLAMVLLFGSFTITAAVLVLLLPETAGHPLPETFEDVENHANNKINILACCKRSSHDDQQRNAKEMEVLA